MLRISTLLFAAAIAAGPAQAGVTYSWQQVSASNLMPAGLNLELEFSEHAVGLGSLKLDFMTECKYGGGCFHPQDSLLSLRYWYDDPAAAGKRHNLIDFDYRSSPNGFFDRIALHLSFLPGGVLGGSIHASNGKSDFLMESKGALFTMQRANSDEQFGCGVAYPNCQGASGMLQVEAQQGEVPEPSSVALAGLGLAAAWFARRRRSA